MRRHTRGPGRARRAAAVTVLLLGAALLAGAAGAQAQTGDVAGLITEIRLARGAVEVKPAGADDWRPAGPLMSLLAGDTVRATEGASAVVLLSGGRGSLRVDAGGGPVLIPGPQGGDSKLRKAGALLAASLGFLSSGAREISQTVIGTRSFSRPPVVLGPRNGPVLADALVFEWVGTRTVTYTVQVVGPAGPVAGARGVPGPDWTYPADAPGLVPGTRYTFRVERDNATQAPQEAWFEVLGAARTRQVREALATLGQEPGAAGTPNTLAAVRAGYLADAGLLHEARRGLLAAIAADPEEPTLHLVLGNVYARAGLPVQARQAHDEARILMGRSAQR